MSSPSLHSDELQNEKSYATVHKEQLDDDVPLLTPAEEKRLTRKIDYKVDSLALAPRQ